MENSLKGHETEYVLTVDITETKKEFCWGTKMGTF